jgi:leucyl/phenylalanyl-tRNA---protein transferase
MRARIGPDDVVECYRRGLFPMAEARDSDRLYIVDPVERGVFLLEEFHVPSRLARTIRSDKFVVSVDDDFEGVMRACAAPAPGRLETWINEDIIRLYSELHARGLAHSVECRTDGALVGGLYGVSLGGAFFGESMFSRVADASKVALVYLAARLRGGGYRLLDAQFYTPHLGQFGAVTIPRARFRGLLTDALTAPGDFFALPRALSGAQLLQSMAQTS